MRTDPVLLRGAVTLAALVLAAVALALPAGDARAQDTTARLYQLEIVIFQHPSGASVELPPRQELPAPGSLASGGMDLVEQDDPGRADAEGLAETLADSPRSLPIGLGPPRLPLQLSAVARALDSRGYRLLWHQAWTQPGASRDGISLAVLAALGQGRADPGLSGAVSLTAGRFLHLGMDLELNSAGKLAAELEQRRRMRLDTEHYFDHPVIGAVAVVRRIEPPPPTADPGEAPAQPSSEP